jgi:hypothetical protein
MEVRPEMRRAVLMKIENNIPDSETYERWDLQTRDLEAEWAKDRVKISRKLAGQVEEGLLGKH